MNILGSSEITGIHGEQKKKDNPKENNRHLTCRICKQLPDRSYVVYCRDKKWGAIPPDSNKLTIVGSPFFKINPHPGSRFRILEQCPYCGTFYRYEFDYEFLAGGSEDEYSLTRISDKTGIDWAKKNYETIYAETPLEEANDWKKKERKTFKFDFEE